MASRGRPGATAESLGRWPQTTGPPTRSGGRRGRNRGQILGGVSPRLLRELTDVLARPKFAVQAADGRADAYIAAFAGDAIQIDDPPDPPAVSPDSDDDHLISLARGCACGRDRLRRQPPRAARGTTSAGAHSPAVRRPTRLKRPWRAAGPRERSTRVAHTSELVQRYRPATRPECSTHGCWGLGTWARGLRSCLRIGIAVPRGPVESPV